MQNLLFVSHAPSANTQSIDARVMADLAEVDDVCVRHLSSLDASADDVCWCDGIIIGTTENFGSIAGLTKDFLERIYYPCLDETQGLPAAVYIRAGLDGQGSIQAIDRITTGLRWRLIQPPRVLHGAWSDAFPGEASELAMTLAVGLAAGIF